MFLITFAILFSFLLKYTINLKNIQENISFFTNESLKTVAVSVEILQIKLINYRLLLYNNTKGDVMVLNYIVPLVVTLVLVALFVTLCTIFLKNASEEKN